MLDVLYLKPKDGITTDQVLQKLHEVVETAQEVNGLLNNCEMDFQVVNGLIAISLYGGTEEDYETTLEVISENFDEVDILELRDE